MIDGQAVGQVLKSKVEASVETTPRIYQINNSIRNHIDHLKDIEAKLKQVVLSLGGSWPEADTDKEESGVSGEECSLDLLSVADRNFGYVLEDIDEHMGRLKQLV